MMSINLRVWDATVINAVLDFFVELFHSQLALVPRILLRRVVTIPQHRQVVRTGTIQKLDADKKQALLKVGELHCHQADVH